MASNKKTTRQRRIVEELNQQPTLRIAELAERLSVSTETIRRDLDDLTEQGVVARTYGGAVRRASAEPGLNERHALLKAEREGIARAAAPLLAGAGHIMIGSGATTMHVARRLAFELNKVTVITHSFGVATVLSLNPTIRVIVAPGVYHAEEGAMHGAQTVKFLGEFTVDWTILGASGLDVEGPSDALIEAAEVYSAMLSRSDRSMIVADSTKFNRRFAARYATWNKLDTLVTDVPPTGGLGAAIAEAGVVVKVATRKPRLS